MNLPRNTGRTRRSVQQRRSPSLRGRVAVVCLSAALAQAAGAADLDEVKRRGVLRIAVAGAPGRTNARFFGTDKQGQLVGIEGELLSGFCQLHDLRAEPVYVPGWDQLIQAAVKGQGDLIAGGVTDTPDRRSLIDFTVETFPTRNVVITRKPHRVVETLEQLRQERVGVPAGSSYGEAARRAGVPPENIDDSYTLTAGAPLLKGGRVTALVAGLEVALMGDLEGGNLQLGTFLGPQESLAIGLRKQDRQLKAALDEYITNLKRTPTWNRLIVKYFGERTLDLLRRLREP